MSTLLLAGWLACGAAIAIPQSTNWALLGNSEEMQHYSDLDQINTATVSRLGLAWWVNMPGKDGLVGNPLIKNGVIFQSGSLDRVYANDLRTGKLLWKFNPQVKWTTLPSYAISRENRGVALWGDLVYVATADCRLIALEQKTGELRWEVQTCDGSKLYEISGAPRVGGGSIFIGNLNGDTGANRGYVDAFEAKTGKHLWRFYTGPSDPLQSQSALYRRVDESWGRDWYSKTRGGANAYDAMTYDPVLHRLYVGTSGPAPWNPTLRGKDAGDELFSNAIVAIDARTGKYLWHFSEVPHDGWNYEATFGIMIAALHIRGVDRRVVISVPKNGFFYVLDAETGKFLSGRNYVPINWAKGLDRNGRPIYDPVARWWVQQQTVIEPSSEGGHSWFAIAYSPVERLVYIPAIIMPMRITRDPSNPVGGVDMDLYYGSSSDARWKAYGELIAWDPITQRARWRVRQTMPINGGLLDTAGGLVFQGGADGYFSAYDARTGRKLWTSPAGGAIESAPSTVMLDGRQYIIVASGNGASSMSGSYETLYASTPRSRSRPRLLAFALDDHESAPPWTRIPRFTKPVHARYAGALAAKGKVLFENQFCVYCHGEDAVSAGGTAPDLRVIQPSLPLLTSVVIGGALKSLGMPQFASLTPDDVKALNAYLVNASWGAYDRQQAAAR